MMFGQRRGFEGAKYERHIADWRVLSGHWYALCDRDVLLTYDSLEDVTGEGTTVPFRVCAKCQKVQLYVTARVPSAERLVWK